MSNNLRIGMIGLDTSHCPAFAKYLNDTSEPNHIPGGTITTAFPAGSPDFELSWSRIEKYTAQLRDEYGVTIVDSIEAVAEQSDAIMITSVDGRVHLEQFKQVVGYGKPVYIDKPFAVSSKDALEMVELAGKHNIPLFSASSIRFSDEIVQALADYEQEGAIYGADVFGPMKLQDTQPGLFWYGIHSVDTLYSIMGRGCEHVTATSNEDHELVVAVWKDGRVGTARGTRRANGQFGAAIHREEGTRFAYARTAASSKPSYIALLDHVMKLFATGKPAVDIQETLEIIRFIEAANESRMTGKTVKL